MKLYEINNEIQRILEGAVDEETGEVLVDFEALDALVEARDAKVQSCGLHYLNRQAEINVIKAEVDRLTDRLNALKKKNEGLLAYIERNLNGDEYRCPQFNIKYTKSSKVEIDEDFCVFAHFNQNYKHLVRTKMEADKVAIGKLLKAGEEIPHATLVQNRTMKIK